MCAAPELWFSQCDPGNLQVPEIPEGGLRSQDYFHTDTKTAFPSLFFTHENTGLQWSFPEAQWPMSTESF